MTNQEIISKLGEVKKGKFISLKKKKELPEGIEKITDLVIRLGVDYSSMKINENRVVGGLPWGHWLAGLEGFVIEHKGNYYLRVASSYSNTTKSQYFKDGKELSKEEVIQLIGEKNIKTKEADIYNIKFENIIALGSN